MLDADKGVSRDGMRTIGDSDTMAYEWCYLLGLSKVII